MGKKSKAPEGRKATKEPVIFTGIRLPKPLHAALSAEAATKMRSLSSLIVLRLMAGTGNPTDDQPNA